MDLEQISAALLVMLLFYKRAGALGRFFDRGISQYLGRISYSLYLSNIIYLILVEHWTRGLSMARSHPLELGLLLAIPVIAAAVTTAHITEKSLERPLIAFGRKLTHFSVSPDSRAAHVATSF